MTIAEPLQIIAADGSVNGFALDLSNEELLHCYRTMQMVRAFDEICMKLQRSGRIGFSIPNKGVEACQVGAASALEKTDWIFPSYRDFGMALYHGVKPVEMMHNMFGNDRDSARGRQMPVHFSFVKPIRFVSISSPIGTHIPQAVGAAYAMKLRGEKNVCLTSFGDGGTSSLGFHSGMNFAAVWKAPVVFLCQNNGYAISCPSDEQTCSESYAIKAVAYGMPGVIVDGNDLLAVRKVVKEAVERAREGGGPTLVEAVTFRMGGHSTSDDPTRYVPKEVVEAWAKKDPVARFERFLASRKLWTPEKGAALLEECMQEITAAVTEAEKTPAPSLESIFSDVYAQIPPHLRRQGQAAFDLAARVGDAAAGGGKFPLYTTMPTLTLVQAVNDALKTAMRRDPTVIHFGEDVGPKGGVFLASDGLTKEFGKSRNFDTPLSEDGIIGTAIGMAMNGLKPVAEIQFQDFIFPAFDQIVSEAAKLRYRSGGQYTAPMVIRTPYGGGIRGGLYHSQSGEAYFCHTPGLKVVVPSTPEDAKGLLLASIEDPDPVLFLEPKALYRQVKGEVPEGFYTTPLSTLRTVRTGKDVTVFCYGAMVPVCQKAAEQAAEKGIECLIVDLRTLLPLDEEGVLEAAKQTGRVVVVHEAPRFCGFGAEISAMIAENIIEYMEAPVARVTGFDTPFPNTLEHHYMPDARRVLDAIEHVGKF